VVDAKAVGEEEGGRRRATDRGHADGLIGNADQTDPNYGSLAVAR
jgi:hypothetical protein